MDASPASLAGWLWLSNAVLDKGALGSAVGLTVPLATPLALLPGLFRLLAFLAILPVVVLSLLDIIGWCFFKGFLRPLGLNTTRQFKDPPPAPPSSDGSQTPSSGSAPSSPELPETPLPTLTPLGSPPKGSSGGQQRDDDLAAAHTDGGAASARGSIPRIVVGHDDFAHAGRESTAQAGASLRRRRRKFAVADDDDAEGGGGLRRRSASSSSIGYARAPSVGVEGPLVEEDSPASSTGQSEDEDEGESDDANDRGAIRRDAVPPGGAAFGFTTASSVPRHGPSPHNDSS